MSIGTRIATELRGDRIIWAVVVLLSIVSVLAVYSSTGTIAHRQYDGRVGSFLFKHIVIMGGGLTLMYLTHLTHYVRYSRWAPVMLLTAVTLLILTLFIGVELNQARRWLQVPFVGLTFQTSDFAKIALIIFVAKSIGSKQDYIKDWKSAFLPIIIPVVLVCLLIAINDVSTALILFGICIIMMIIGRVAIQYIGLLILLGISVFSLMVVIGDEYPELLPRMPTVQSRMAAFFSGEEAAADADQNYQINKAKVALANGGIIGQGPGNSTQRNYLPHPYSDFIFAIIVEEYGALGGILLIGVYLLLFFRVVRLVTKSPKTFGAMVALGLSLLIVLQAFINIAVVLNLVPVTGIPLPLVSMGGTSFLFTCLAFGVILSVSKYIETTAA
ncbi:MAG: FtsW/RodA/SpoVE family cell cycle protein [Bacteroidota bacterium]